MEQQGKTPPDIDARYRTLLILWFAQLMTIGFLCFFSRFFGPEVGSESLVPHRSLLIISLTVLGTVLVITSFAVKRTLLDRSVAERKPELVQNALIVASVMCEVSALLGLLERFLIGNGDYYLLFLIAAAGTAFHFPRRDQLLSATYKTSPGGSVI